MKKIVIATLAILLCSCINNRPKTPAESTTADTATAIADSLDAIYAVDMLKCGTAAPELSLNDLRGKPRSLAELRGKKVVLVFWASWCPDCRSEIPVLKAMQANADPEKVAFLSVSFDRDIETLCSFVENNFLGGIQLFDPAGKKDSKVAADFGVKWIPSLYLIDEDGNIAIATVVADRVAEALGTYDRPATYGGPCTDDSCSQP